MGFLDRLREQNNPVGPPAFGNTLGGSPVSYGGARELPIEGLMSRLEPFMARQRTANLEDMRSQQNIANSSPSVQDGRIRQIADPNNTASMNTVLAPGMTDYQKATLGQGQQQIDLEKGKAAVSARTGDERLNVLEGRLKLDTEKNANIYDTKVKELEQKATIAERTAEIARERIAAGETSATLRAEVQRATIEAQNARHAADLAIERGRAADTERLTSVRIKELEDQIAGRNTPKTEETDLKFDKDGNVIGRTTTTGKAKTNTTAPKAPVGWKYIPKAGGGWTAVEDKK